MDTNQDSWKQLERVKCYIYGAFIALHTILQTSPSTSQALVSGTEQFTKILSETLSNDVTEVTKTKPNIGKVALCVVVLFP